MLDKEEQRLWNSIKAGDVKYVEIIDMPVGICTLFNDSGHVDFSRAIETKTMRLTLNELIEGSPNCKLLIYPPSMDYPYWLESISMVNPHTFEYIAKMTPYLRVAIAPLTGSQIRWEDKQFEIAQNKKKEYESIFIDNTDYKRNRLMLLLTN